MSKRLHGTVATGIRAPIVREGDDIAEFVSKAVLDFISNRGAALRDRDVVGVTEALVARAQGNYANLDDLTADVREKFPDKTMGVVFPILSRNRFSLLLKAMARAVDKLYLLLSYPHDEVGNPLVSMDKVDAAGVNPFTDTLSEEKFKALFGSHNPHRFTGVDYFHFYKNLAPNIEIVFSNRPEAILAFTPDVLCADIHSRFRTKARLQKAGARRLFTMDDLLSKPVNGSGHNPDYGILGSNMASAERIKLFPRDCGKITLAIQQKLAAATGKNVEVMVYGDGGFKDPVCGIWELADPVVSPGYTPGLEGSPSELKIKFLADSEFSNKQGGELEDCLKQAIKDKALKLDDMAGEGTTPRRYVDLLGSLCDLTTGSGDKGTPIVLIQGYFDDYSTE